MVAQNISEKGMIVYTTSTLDHDTKGGKEDGQAASYARLSPLANLGKDTIVVCDNIGTYLGGAMWTFNDMYDKLEEANARFGLVRANRFEGEDLETDLRIQIYTDLSSALQEWYQEVEPAYKVELGTGNQNITVQLPRYVSKSTAEELFNMLGKYAGLGENDKISRVKGHKIDVKYSKNITVEEGVVNIWLQAKRMGKKAGVEKMKRILDLEGKILTMPNGTHWKFSKRDAA